MSNRSVDDGSASTSSSRSSSPDLAAEAPEDERVRKHISNLRHSIRLQHAQLHRFDDVRDMLNAESSTSSPAASTDYNHTEDASTPPSSYSRQPGLKRNSSLNGAQSTSKTGSPRRNEVSAPPSAFTSNGRTRKRPSASSFDTMLSDSNTPIVEESTSGPEEDQETGRSHQRRLSSPTRTLNRIPVASVSNARALAEDGQALASAPIRLESNPSPSYNSNRLSVMSLPVTPSISPTSKRLSLMSSPGGTSKVLADLASGINNTKSALENTKAQLRISQRTVAQLTRETADLKDGRDRLKLENEGLNNVVARKERLLQELLERAKQAESEVSQLRSQIKFESTASNKTEREYIVLRDSIKQLQEGWRTEVIKLKEEMTRREERLRREAESVGKKFKVLLGEVQSVETGKATLRNIKLDDQRTRKELEESFRTEIATLKAQVEKSVKEGDEANATARSLALELGRLRRLVQQSDTDLPNSQ